MVGPSISMLHLRLPKIHVQYLFTYSSHIHISVKDLNFTPKPMKKRQKFNLHETGSFPRPPPPRRGKKVGSSVLTNYHVPYVPRLP